MSEVIVTINERADGESSHQATSATVCHKGDARQPGVPCEFAVTTALDAIMEHYSGSALPLEVSDILSGIRFFLDSHKEQFTDTHGSEYMVGIEWFEAYVCEGLQTMSDIVKER